MYLTEIGDFFSFLFLFFFFRTQLSVHRTSVVAKFHIMGRVWMLLNV